MNQFDSVFQANAGYVDEMYARYADNPKNVSPEWCAYFEGFNEGFKTATQLTANGEIVGALHKFSELQRETENLSRLVGTDAQASTSMDYEFEFKTFLFGNAYKAFGHLEAKINPLTDEYRRADALRLESYGLSEADLQKTTHVGLSFGWAPSSLAHFVEKLRGRYCSTVGFEIEHIANPEERDWLHQAIDELHAPVDSQVQKKMLEELTKADAMEKTIGTKFIGKKRFSIEGADAQIPAIESYMDELARLGTKEFALAMAHRGRLNILVHVAGKPLKEVVAEFEGYPNPNLPGDGDVKYHNGWEGERTSRGGEKIAISLSYNPSHLEFVDAVVTGEARAKQDRFYDGKRDSVAAMILHGDAAIAGQGVVYETVEMMNLKGYKVGGTLHLVANNQIGFTTNPSDSRSTVYCTDVAKTISVPVFHVNSDDIDALHNVMRIAARYKHKFQKDVFVDLVCFRRHGHNEGDEPMFTQPLLYTAIKAKPAPYETYLQYLVKEHGFKEEDGKQSYQNIRNEMNVIFDAAKAEKTPIGFAPWTRGWKSLRQGKEKDIFLPVKTGVKEKNLKALGETICTLPASFTLNPKLARIIIGERKEMMEGNKRIDWGMCELLAYGSLLSEGFSVRLSGQDVGRGTFAHRHATFIDFKTADRYVPLQQIGGEGKFEVINSFLSETAAMGFEYGYATTHEKSLVVWEGQYGDFANGAQPIIDLFIAAGETKWGRTQGLVLLLPHGMEGGGPEHSSARLERFLQLAAQGNMQVCYFTNGAQLFHALRRQMLRDFRKPLVVMTPKSFLRNPRASSSFEDLENGQFEEILDDNRKLDPKKVKSVVFATGKLAIELLDTAEKDNKGNDVAIVRVEQIAPFAHDKAVQILKRYSAAKQVVWAQEEPKNMGAYTYLRDRLLASAKAAISASNGIELGYIGRIERASPAVGVEKLHIAEQDKIIQAVLSGENSFEV